MSTAVFREDVANQRWLLPVSGNAVAMLIVDFAVTIRIEPDMSLRIEDTFTFVRSTGESVQLVPAGDPVALAPVLATARMTVAAAHANFDGSLKLSFTDGSRLEIHPSDDYEAWSFSGEDSLRVVSLPGGQLAVWMPGQAAGRSPSVS